MMTVGFLRPVLRPDVVVSPLDDGVTFTYLDGQRFLEIGFPDERVAAFHRYVESIRGNSAEVSEFPGSAEELGQFLDALDEQGMLAEGETAAQGVSGLTAYLELRRQADRVRDSVRSAFVEALTRGEVSSQQMIGYAVEYWHVTHLCPRALAPVLARDDLAPGVWDEVMAFYQAERNHDRMLEKSLASVGISRDQLWRTQPLPATAAMMAALGGYAADFPLALLATLFPMEDPEPEFLDLLSEACAATGLPAEFIRPLAAHSGVNDDEEHGAVSLQLLSKSSFVSDEEVDELCKAVADIIEQRARLDAEIMAWYADGGLRNWDDRPYPLASGTELTCAAARWQG